MKLIQFAQHEEFTNHYTGKTAKQHFPVMCKRLFLCGNSGLEFGKINSRKHIYIVALSEMFLTLAYDKAGLFIFTHFLEASSC